MKGILMKPDMHLATRELRKTVTRRLAGLKEINQEPDKWKLDAVLDDGTACFLPKSSNNPVDVVFVKPRYQVGEVVYIKEAWRVIGRGTTEHSLRLEIQYKADMSRQWFSVDQATFHKYTFDSGWGVESKWRSPLFLPEKYARSFIKILDVRDERLQEITEEDATAEGILWVSIETTPSSGIYRPCAIENFNRLWDSINKEHPWESNPWVWRYEFELETK